MADPLGVSIAFGDEPLEPDPTWTRIDTLTGCRVQEWSIRRGRATEFDDIEAGEATVRIIDREGLFDPTNGSSAYFGEVLPDRQAALALRDPVQGTWHTLFRGFVEDWDYTLDLTRQFFVLQLRLVDAFGWLNEAELMPGEAGVVPLPAAVAEGNVFYEDTAGSVDDRLLAILSDVGWPSALTSIFSGNVKVQETVYAAGTSALSALQDAAQAEFPGVAIIYVDKEGILTFHGRQARFRPDVAEYGINRRDVGDPSVTDSDDTVAPISELSFNLGKANLYNSVLVTPQGVADDDVAGQLVEYPTSIAAHGKKSLVFTDLLTLLGIATGNDANEETLLMATYFGDNYHDPLPRISRMVFKSKMPTHRLADPLWKMMCRCEISDLLTVTTAHPGGGGFDEEGYYVEGIRYECRPANDQVHEVVLEVDVSPQALFASNPFEADPDPDA